MKNKFTFIGLIQISVVLILGIGCQPAATGTNSQVVNSSVNVAKQAVNANGVATPASTSTSDVGAGSLATPTEAYKTAFGMREKKDVAGLKKIMAPDMIEFLTMVGEEEKKSLDDMVKEMFRKPQADRAEVRNEKIKGDLATVEYLTETGTWKTMDFQKIDNQWKLSFPKAEK